MIAEKRELCFYFFLDLTAACLLLSPESCVLTYSNHVLLSFALRLIVDFFACRGYAPVSRTLPLREKIFSGFFVTFQGQRLGFTLTPCFNITISD